MSFDDTYDELLHDEFSTRGKHQAEADGAETALTQSTSRGRHAAPEEPEAQAAEPPRGLQRYRTAGLVGAGGLACAAAGAFLGGLGGYFTISPAAAHAVADPAIIQDLPLAPAVSHGAHSTEGARGTSALTTADFSRVLGSLTKGIAPFAPPAADPSANLPVNGLPGTGGKGLGTGGGAGNGTVHGGGGPGCTSGSSGLDLTCILSNLTGTLTNLTAMLPSASLPLPSGGLPTTIPGPSAGGALTGGTGANPVVGALAPVLRTVGSVTGGTGSTGTPIPSLPLPTTTGTTPPGALPAGTLTPTTTPSSGTSTVTVPVPANAPTVTVGGLSVGVNGSGSSSGLTLTLP